MKRCFLSLILFVVLVSLSPSYSQTFTTVPFITMSGDNTDVDVLYSSSYNNIVSFICWVNKTDSTYSLYLRQTSPDYEKNILVYTDTAQIAKPCISFIASSNYNNVRIAWQSFVNNHWQILYRSYISDTLSNTIAITDSLKDYTNPQLDIYTIAWIQGGNLLFKFFDSLDLGPYIFDTAGCSSPKISKYNGGYKEIEIIYEKGSIGNKQIIEGHYGCCSRSDTIRNYNIISNGGNNLNPRFGVESGFSYQALVNGVWKSVYAFTNYPDTTNNIISNYTNPICFSYPILTKKNSMTTPFFVLYDSDSLKNNKEIFMKTWFYSDSVTNISKAEGDDYSPNISFNMYKDTVYYNIYWTHEQNGKKDIWMAYAKYEPNYGAVGNEDVPISGYLLEQNYPNPFNPSSEIKWQLAKGCPVTLKVFDILGNEIATLVNEFQTAGEHSITFDTQKNISSRLSSGIYFYQIKAGSFTQTKKMLYLK